jgi:hypothetical protein
MMREARLAISKVNVALERSQKLTSPLCTFALAEEHQVYENA